MLPAPHRSIETFDETERFLIQLLDGLWARYRSRMEPVRRYEHIVQRQKGVLRNDHIAFRTIAWQNPPAGVFTLSRLFEALGYAPAGGYAFPDKYLTAVHFQHPNPKFPKLFISQLESWKLPPAAAAIVERCLELHGPAFSQADLTALAQGPRPPDLLARCLDFLSKRPWPAPKREDVLALDAVSQYAAWVLLHGYDVNHFTALVDDIEKTVAAMRADGLAMKADIEGAPGTSLRQSSTAAVMLPVEVAGGYLDWPYAYFELAQRADGFEGFLGGQATNLFEVTKKR